MEGILCPWTWASDAAKPAPVSSVRQPASQPSSFSRTSRYLSMRDGTRIAIDVYLPDPLPQEKSLPTMIHQTRYWRAFDYRWPVNLVKPSTTRGLIGLFAKQFLAYGYAWVDVDVRGSGASFGSRPFSHSPDEIRDGGEIVEWIVRQPWSNGKIGTLGISYGGTSAELLLANQHPAVKAAAPLFSGFDLYPEIAFPGGIQLTWFSQTWSDITRQLDSNSLPFSRWWTKFFIRGVAPVDQDSDRTLLDLAIQEHASNWNPHKEGLGITFRDDPPPSRFAPSINALSPFAYANEIDKSGAAVYSYSGWFDGGYQHAAIRRHLTLHHPHNKLRIGPWDHGGRRNISPFGTGPSQFDHVHELIRFFDFHVKGLTNGLQQEPPIYYFTMGEERWKGTETWPPLAIMTSFFFDENQQLASDTPQLRDGSDMYQVDPTAGTGSQSRWHTLVGRPIINPYPNRAKQDHKLFHYTSDPLLQDLEVTGHPIVHLFLTSTATDGAVFLYLEDIDENGRISYVTEGMLRLLHRQLSAKTPPYHDVVPYRTFTRPDGLFIQPGKLALLTFDLFPTSYLFKKGHRIRVAIAGADRDHFRPIPSSLYTHPPTLTVFRNAQFPSHIQLPVISQKALE